MIYYSHRTRKALAKGNTYLPLGFAHYSYGSVCQKFLKMFKEGGVRAQEVLMPEIYANASHLPPTKGGSRPLHISFKPYEEIRLLKGAANVAHVAWEFDKVPNFAELPFDHQRRDNILNDYVHVLGLVSEIWVGCQYTKTILQSYGLSHVEVVPAPIAMEIHDSAYDLPFMAGLYKIRCLEFTRKRVAQCIDTMGPLQLDNSTMFRAEGCRAAGGRVFLSVLNPGDPRKNIAALFLGFQEHLRRTKRSDLLIVKLVLDGSPESLRHALAEQFPKHFEYSRVPLSFIDCENILLVPDFLSVDELNGLYHCADFYLCTSAAEGQGLPMQEAMAAGLVPISSAETAMADYIDDNHAIVMKSTPMPIPLQVAQAYGLWGVAWRLVDHHEVVSALQCAVELSPREYERRSLAAKSFVCKEYGFDRIRDKFLERSKELTK